MRKQHGLKPSQLIFISESVSDLVVSGNNSQSNGDSLEDMNFQIDIDNLKEEETTVEKDTTLEKETKAEKDTTLEKETTAEKETNVEQETTAEEDNINLNIEDLDIAEETPENINELTEFNLDSSLENVETIVLKKPNQVYYEIYQKAREKAKEAKKVAITAYLEMKNIKKTYMLDDIDDIDDSENDSEFDELTNNDMSDTESLADSF